MVATEWPGRGSGRFLSATEWLRRQERVLAGCLGVVKESGACERWRARSSWEERESDLWLPRSGQREQGYRALATMK